VKSLPFFTFYYTPKEFIILEDIFTLEIAKRVSLAEQKLSSKHGFETLEESPLK